jgi:hypothetical protein
LFFLVKSCFFLIEKVHISRIIFVKNWNLVGSIYGMTSLNSAHFVLIHLQTWPPQAILVLNWSISKNLLFWNCFAKMNRNFVESTYGRFCIIQNNLYLIWYLYLSVLIQSKSKRKICMLIKISPRTHWSLSG